MNRFVVAGLIVLLIGLLGLVAWNLNPLAQAQASTANTPYGRGMGRGMMGQSSPNNYPAGMMGGMMGRFADPGSVDKCPCTANASPDALAPSTSATPSAGSSSSAASSSASSKPANAMTAKAGNLNVTLVMTPPPAAFSTTTFDITITDERGAAVSDAKVSLDLTMPSMWMPSNKPQAQSLGNGKYQAVGRFTMRGGWRIDVVIERGGQKQNAYFDIGL